MPYLYQQKLFMLVVAAVSRETLSEAPICISLTNPFLCLKVTANESDLYAAQA